MRFLSIGVFLFIHTIYSYAQIYNPKIVYQHLKSTNDYVLQHHILEQYLGFNSDRCGYVKEMKNIITQDKSLDIASAIILLLEARECSQNPQQQELTREKAFQIIRASKEPCFDAFVNSRIALGKASQAAFNSDTDYLSYTKQLLKGQECSQYLYIIPEVNHLIASKHGKTDIALKEILEAEFLYKQHSQFTSFGWVNIQKHLGLIFYQTKNYSAALKHWNQALDAFEKFSIKIRTLVSLHNDVGLAYKNLKDYEKSFYHLTKAIDIAKEIKDSIWIGIPQGNIADILIEQEKYEQAQIYLDNYLDYGLQFQEHGIVVSAYVKQATINYKQKNANKALQWLRLGENYLAKYDYQVYSTNKIAYLEYKKRLYDAYIQILASIQDYTNAFKYQKKYQETVDSFNLIFNKDKIAEIEGFYKFKEQETENKLLKEQAQNRDNEIIQHRIIIFTTSLIALISIVGGIYMLTYFRLRKKYIKNLEYVNNFKSKIFSVVSHDLRGYMSSLKGFVYLVRNQELDKKDLDIITEELSKNTEYTSDLMDNLLLWAKSQLEGQKLKLENHPVKEMIMETIFEVGWFSNNKKISIDVEASDNLIVHADKNVFEIALRNLLTNAIKFTKIGGKIWVKADKSDRFCEVSVIDMGVGISSEDLLKIRNGISVTNKGTQLEKGIGLGLVLCRDSIQESGGNFYIESSLNKGTTVKFTLPLAVPSQTKNDIMQNSNVTNLV